MTRAALALALVLGTATTAAADGLYFSEAFGGTDVGDELSAKMESAVRVRLAVGWRINRRWAVEGFFSADIGTGSTYYEDGYATRSVGGGEDCVSCGGSNWQQPLFPPTLTTAGIDVKYLHPVSKYGEVYLRGGLGKGWLDGDDYAGRGLGVGAGAQIKGKVPVIGFLFWPLFFTGWGPKVTAALYVDASTDFYRLHRHGDLSNTDSIDASLNRITMGFAVGSDF